MNAMVPGLAGGKMSSSDSNSKIDFLDTADSIRKKVKAAFCEEGNVEENGLLSFIDAVIIPVTQLRIDRIKGDTLLEDGLGDQSPFISDNAPDGTVFSVERDEKFGGPLHYKSFAEIQNDFKEKALHPKDLKVAVANAIVRLLEPIRKAFEENEGWKEAERHGYPDPNAKPEKKKKKVSRQSIYLSHQITSDFDREGKGIPSSSSRKGKEPQTCRSRWRKTISV